MGGRGSVGRGRGGRGAAHPHVQQPAPAERRAAPERGGAAEDERDGELLHAREVRLEQVVRPLHHLLVTVGRHHRQRRRLQAAAAAGFGGGWGLGGRSRGSGTGGGAWMSHER